MAKCISLSPGDICFNYVMPGDKIPTVIVIGRTSRSMVITSEDGTEFTFEPRKDPDGKESVVLKIEKDGCTQFWYMYVHQDDDGVWGPCLEFTAECYVLDRTEEGDECDVFTIANFREME